MCIHSYHFGAPGGDVPPELMVGAGAGGNGCGTDTPPG